GEHKLLCGDATKADDFKALLGDELVDMTFTDPPYNVNYANTAKDKMRGKNRPIMNDNLGDGFGSFLTDACTNILTHTKGAVYIAMSSSELDTLQSAFRAAGGRWSTFIIWAKNTFTLGRADYQRQYEPILYGWRDGADHFWCGARDQGDVWNVKKPQKNDLHPTACEKSGRRARLIELDPKYVDVIVKRWEEFTGKKATRLEEGDMFNRVDSNRDSAPDQTVGGPSSDAP
ncbi:MAG: site-specific DNA-methyltransferase, partial [Betaproteobacteria bacterium]|nr:site-specific DNA-methyltransferase [Betaproteobacteria bacterium]